MYSTGINHINVYDVCITERVEHDGCFYNNTVREFK